MTFDEALNLKSTLAEKIIYKDLTFTPYIIPKDRSDFDAFTEAFRHKKMTDESAKFYSKNNEYSVRGICYFSDINNLYFLDLPLK